MNPAAALCCCTKIKNGRSLDRNRPLSCGGAMGIRTPDLLHAMEARYQLRHSPLRSRMSLAAPGGCPVPLSGHSVPEIRLNLTSSPP